MYGPRYVWMLVGWYKSHWWETEDTQCTIEELRQAVEGYFSVDTLNSIIGDTKAVSGLVSGRNVHEMCVDNYLLLVGLFIKMLFVTKSDMTDCVQ